MEISPKFDSYSKVILWVDEETAYISGDDSGRVFEADLPWGTQQIADEILASIVGFSYQPAAGTDALIDPAAELGDGITLSGVYSQIAALDTILDPLFTSDVSAPHDEEVDHEYPYISPAERELKRKIALGKSYYGARITRAAGLEITKTEADGTEKSRVKLNSDTLAFFDDSGQESLYFDATRGIYIFRGDVAITGGTMNVNNNFIVDADGNLTVNGNINLSKGNIIWGGNVPSGGISESEAKTLINSTLVSSPNIAGGKFLNLIQDTWIEIGAKSGKYGMVLADNANTRGIFSVYNGDFGYSSFYGKAGYCFLIVDGNGIDGFNVTYPQEKWDFSSATVTGLSVVFG